MKKLVSLLTACILLLCMTTVALADDRPPAPTIGNAAPNNVAITEVGEGIAPLSASTTISFILTRNSLQVDSPGYLKLYAYTAVNISVDKIYHSLELQRWNGTDWVAYYSTYAYDTDCPVFDNYSMKLVTRDSYYRLKTVHSAYYGAQYISRTVISNYIYAD